jgi:hypothetical protein
MDLCPLLHMAVEPLDEPSYFSQMFFIDIDIDIDKGGMVMGKMIGTHGDLR